MKIPKDIAEIHARFISAGKELYLVGGCVRDSRLKITPKDFDMATNAFPEEIETILSGYDLGITGKNFGVMRVYTKDEPTGYEIATYREDISVGRKPTVKIGSTIENDAKRRDFTINALYYDISTSKIIDLVGGEKDLESLIIRACGNALERITEDALRMLRGVRIKNIIAGNLDEELHEAILSRPALECPDENGNIVPISQERISEEFLKGLSKVYNDVFVKSYINDLIKYQFIGQIFRGLHVNENFIAGSKTPEVTIADLLRFNTDLKDLFKKLVHVNMFNKKIAEGVIFLLSLDNLNDENAYTLRKQMSKTNLTMNHVLEYGEIMHENGNHARLKYLYAFTKYEITTSGDVLKEKEGFKDGEALGAEIKRRETENFKNIYQTI